MKPCSYCHIEKPLNAFGKAKTCVGGLNTVCLTCLRSNGRRYYATHRKALLDQAKKRNATAHEKKRRQQYDAERRRDPVVIARTKALNVAYRSAMGFQERRRARRLTTKNAETEKQYGVLYRSRPEVRIRRSESHRLYRATKPEYDFQKRSRRRLARKQAETRWDQDLDGFVFTEAAALVRLRTRTLGGAWHIDHIEPLKGKDVCGLHNAYNVSVVPALYNLKKGNRRMEGNWIEAFAR